jgi:hypothetical protein
MFSVMDTEPRLGILQLLLNAHPEGLVVDDIQQELDILDFTLSHHLDKLKNEELVLLQRESTLLRYTANTEPCSTSCDSSTPNAVPATKRSSRKTSSRFANGSRPWTNQISRKL